MANIKLDKQSYVADPLYQWDKNQTLTIYGMSLPSIPEIHFANVGMDRAIVRQSTMSKDGVVTVEVPNSLLQKPQNVIVYVCIYSGNTFETWYKFEVPLKARQKPSDYTIEADNGEIYSFRALENRLNNTIANTNARYEEITKEHNEAIATLNESIETYNAATETLNETIEAAEKKYNEAVAVFDQSVEKLRADINKKTETSATTVTLPVANWSSLSQTVTVQGVTANNNVIVSPTAESHSPYGACAVKCSAQAENSLTFVCNKTPSVDLVVNVLIINGAVNT